MADFGSAAVAIGSTLTGIVTGAKSASDRNRSNERTKASAIAAAKEQTRQVNEAAGLERLKRKRESDQIRGRLSAIAGASGVDPSGSYAALDRQAQYDQDFNLDIIEQNRRNEVNRVDSGLRANLERFSDSERNVLLDAFAGGAEGLGTGLQIGRAIPDATPQLYGDERDFFT